MQDARFVNVNAVNLMWIQKAQFMADGLTFSNVTTTGAQWDSRGAVVRGDGDKIVYDFTFSPSYLELPSSPSIALTDDFVPRLTQDDAWFVEVQAVRPLTFPLHIAVRSGLAHFLHRSEAGVKHPQTGEDRRLHT